MEFNKNRIYTSVNADELKIGSKVYVSDNMYYLKECVEKNFESCILTRVLSEKETKRFCINNKNNEKWQLAYLIELPAKFKYKPFSNMENIKKASVKCKGFIKTKQGAQEGIIIGISFDYRAIIKIRWGVNYLTFEQLFESYTFDDGTPCGELVEE